MTKRYAIFSLISALALTGCGHAAPQAAQPITFGSSQSLSAPALANPAPAYSSSTNPAATPMRPATNIGLAPATVTTATTATTAVTTPISTTTANTALTSTPSNTATTIGTTLTNATSSLTSTASNTVGSTTSTVGSTAGSLTSSTGTLTSTAGSTVGSTVGSVTSTVGSTVGSVTSGSTSTATSTGGSSTTTGTTGSIGSSTTSGGTTTTVSTVQANAYKQAIGFGSLDSANGIAVFGGVLYVVDNARTGLLGHYSSVRGYDVVSGSFTKATYDEIGLAGLKHMPTSVTMCQITGGEVLASNGQTLYTFGMTGSLLSSAAGTLTMPTSVVDPKTGDTFQISGNQVNRLHNGTVVCSFGSDKIGQAVAIAVDTDGTLYVSDQATAEVHQFAPAAN